MDGENNPEGDVQEVVIQEVGDDSVSVYSPIVSAILTIPATLVCLAFFACVYRIFINRRTRS